MSFHRNRSSPGGEDAQGRHGAESETLVSSAPAHEKSGPEDHTTVSTNWGNKIPVGEAELVVLELYLADAIDQLIASDRKRGKGSSQARGPP